MCRRTPDSNLTVLAPLAATVCNADAANEAQSTEPYGVREGLTAFVLAFSGSALVKATTAPSESQAREAGGDRDGDGIPDDEDECPNQPGPASTDGCPDSDGDGIPDNEDDCPQDPGPERFNGCPDSDVDGIPDNEDACPQDPGPERFNGCPDSDGDGIPDNEDACRRIRDPEKYDGCPDSDGDGLPDNVDECPQDPGPESNNGCPLGGVGGEGAGGGAGDGLGDGSGADDSLASTGADIGRFALIGLAVFALGLLGMALGDRRRVGAGRAA